ncbi:hypothetical protein [Paenibacillus alvei]|uniref:hypothetical protein n=1 Tax=Paenibacillus alvei TaxID=44250 RepID=UPI001F506D7A|nr:hypothetical protein [Paenibacillus alvei]MBG9743840.1 hypothetical protein [Paenibacillus alvei]
MNYKLWSFVLSGVLLVGTLTPTVGAAPPPQRQTLQKKIMQPNVPNESYGHITRNITQRGHPSHPHITTMMVSTLVTLKLQLSSRIKMEPVIGGV